MTDKAKVRIVVDEDATIVARLDAIAERESISRADVLRRAIRLLIFTTRGVPIFGNSSTPETEEIAAA
jgi:metal-responsive CopG/Arc/MetJ family transcriptional regulator